MPDLLARRRIDIHAHAADHEGNPVGLRLGFSENARHFGAVYQQVVRPFDAGPETGRLMDA
ncbi:hypothetical protein RZS08_52200, partial [Arthrospira platensis SPKY1]|nr:hypothetical protein [Arthrospira platensis SPKY1]